MKNMKKTLALLLALAMCVSMLGTTALAAPRYEEEVVAETPMGEEVREGSQKSAAPAQLDIPEEVEEPAEIEETPAAAELMEEQTEAQADGINWDASEITITTVEGLQEFAAKVNAGNAFEGKTVKLGADIDLTDVEWTPIGTANKPFKGTFDGGGNTISNLTCIRGLENAAGNNRIGLFGVTNDPAVIKNLTIKNVTLKGSLHVGAVVGSPYTGKEISNVTVKGDIKIDAYWYAGVIGGNGYLDTVKNCKVEANEGSYIRGNDGSYIGGIWGFRGEGNKQTTNCSVSGLSISGVDRVGGISGMAHYGNEISGCTASKVTVTATDEEATTVGLIAGACQGGDEGNAPSIIKDNTFTEGTVTIGDKNVTESVGEHGTNINGIVPVVKDSPVAKIGNTGYETLAAALAAVANSSDKTITIVKSGGYAPITVPAGVTVQAAEGVAVTFKGSFEGSVKVGANVTFKNLTFVGANPLNSSVGDNLTVENCTFEGDSSDTGTAMYIHTPNITVENCTFKNYRRGYYTCGDNHAIGKIEFTDNTFENVKIPFDGYWGKKATGSTRVTITGNTFDNGEEPVYVCLWDYTQYLNSNQADRQGSALANVTVSGNTGNYQLQLIHTDWRWETPEVTTNTNVVYCSYVEVENAENVTALKAQWAGEGELPGFMDHTTAMKTKDGKFYFYEIPVGQYNVTVTYTNGASVTQEFGVVTQTAGENTTQKFQPNTMPKAVKIGETEYDTLQAAIDAAKDGDTVYVIANGAGRGSVKDGKKITVNIAEGVTVSDTQYYGLAASGGAELTVTGAGNIKGGTTANIGGIHCKAATVIVSKDFTGTISADSGIGITCFPDEELGGTVNVHGGTITGSKYGIYCKKGTVNVSGGTVNGEKALGHSGAKITVSGGTFSSDVSWWVIAGKYQDEDGTVKDVTADKAEAQIGETYYLTLQAAIDDVKSSNEQVTVKLRKNVTAPYWPGEEGAPGVNVLVIEPSCNVILDMAGHTITGAICNYGTLTITGNGTVDNTGNAYSNPAVENWNWGEEEETIAKLTIENGTYKAKKPETGEYRSLLNAGGAEAEIKGGNFPQGVRNGQWLNDSQTTKMTIGDGVFGAASDCIYGLANYAGTVTIKDGTFTGGVACSAVQNYAKMTIEGGTFQENGSQGAAVTNMIFNNSPADLTIKGGTFYGRKPAGAQGNIPAVQVLDGAQTTIQNGTFEGEGTAVSLSRTEADKVKISGGTFSHDVSAYCLEGLTWDKNTQGIVPATDTMAMVSGVSATKTFNSLAEAITYAQAGDTVELLDDVATTAQINITKNITLNGNGKTLTYANPNPNATPVQGTPWRISALQVYHATVAINDLTIVHNTGAALIVNGGTVTATNLKTAPAEGADQTASNFWGGVNLDHGAGFRFPEGCSFGEANKIWVDDEDSTLSKYPAAEWTSYEDDNGQTFYTKVEEVTMTLDQSSYRLYHNSTPRTVTLTATVSGILANKTAKVSWTSNNTDVATVDENGVVTAVANGTAIITASSGKLSAKCAITVSTYTPSSRPSNTEDLGDNDVPLTDKPFLFTDVAESDWFYDAVKYAFNNDLMLGTTDTTFEPGMTASRGMIVTMLYRLEKEPTAATKADFPDVEDGAWYTEAVHWGNEAGVVTGYSDGRYAPDDMITREQLVVILYRYAKLKGCDVSARADLSKYADADQVSGYATEAMAWAVEIGLVKGTSDTTLSPAGDATRGQIATIMTRLCEDVLPKEA